MNNYNNNSSPSRMRPVLIVLLVIAGIYLIVDHGQHVLPFLPLTFLLGCFFMHLFMHGGHGSHGGHGNKNGQVEDKQDGDHSGHMH